MELDKDLQVRHQTILIMKQHYWMQRLKINWALHGDMNTRFFHASAITRKRRNTIAAIQNSQGDWETDEGRIHNLFVAHFKSIYTKRADSEVQATFHPDILLDLPKIPTYLHEALTAQPTSEEIHRTVMALGPDKAPGPDGINAGAIQKNWALFGPPLLQEVRKFFVEGIMNPKAALTNLVLVPKKEEPKKVEDF